MRLCKSTGYKVTSCQSWRFDKIYCPRPQSNHTSVARVRFLDDRIILQLWQLVTFKPVDPETPTVPLWKDLNLLNKHSFNSEDQQNFQDRFFLLKITPFTYGLFNKWSIFIVGNCMNQLTFFCHRTNKQEKAIKFKEMVVK